MKTFTHLDAPLKVFGVPFFEDKKVFERLPLELREQVKSLEFLGRRTPGARIGFRTDATEFTVELTLETLKPDIGMALFSCQSVEVLIGDRKNHRFAGLVTPPDYNTKTCSKTFKKSSDMEDVLLLLPRNEVISEVKVSIPDEAKIEAPTPYKYGPILYYGSSITEGGCCCRMANAYNALLSLWLDVDYYNFGFSGSAKGELEIADYINTIEISAFVYDYDHNAPSVEHLENTHYPFYKRIREKNPNIPIIMMSRPNFGYWPDDGDRRAVVKSTYEKAKAEGDNNVYFIDGELFFGTEDRQACTIDTVHPNDLGFYRMAKVIEPIFKEALNIK